MRFMKTLLAIVGVLVLAGGAGFMGYLALRDMNSLWMVANANKSSAYPNPMIKVWIAAALGALGAFLFGLGLGMPRRLAGSVRKEALENVAARREGEIRDRAAQTAQNPNA